MGLSSVMHIMLNWLEFTWYGLLEWRMDTMAWLAASMGSWNLTLSDPALVKAAVPAPYINKTSKRPCVWLRNIYDRDD